MPIRKVAIKKAELLNDDSAFKGATRLRLIDSFSYFFLNFLLKPASPIKPEPSKSMVAGSGTG